MLRSVSLSLSVCLSVCLFHAPSSKTVHLGQRLGLL